MRADTRRKTLPKLIELCVVTARLVGAYLRDSNTLPGGGGRSYPTKIVDTGQEPCTGRLRPEVSPLTPLYTTFVRNGTPFTYLV